MTDELKSETVGLLTTLLDSIPVYEGDDPRAKKYRLRANALQYAILCVTRPSENAIREECAKVAEKRFADPKWMAAFKLAGEAVADSNRATITSGKEG